MKGEFLDKRCTFLGLCYEVATERCVLEKGHDGEHICVCKRPFKVESICNCEQCQAIRGDWTEQIKRDLQDPNSPISKLIAEDEDEQSKRD